MAQKVTNEWTRRAMTVARAARYMGVGRQVIYTLIDIGELNAVKQDGTIYVDRFSVDAFRQAGKLT